MSQYRLIDTTKFEHVVGSEVGLQGHFVTLADAFLKDNGVFGAVLPINLLRGRESEKVRRLVFSKWLPLYVIKASKNYGFSEYAEYRDVLIIAKKAQEEIIYGILRGYLQFLSALLWGVYLSRL